LPDFLVFPTFLQPNPSEKIALKTNASLSAGAAFCDPLKELVLSSLHYYGLLARSVKTSANYAFFNISG
jgi:hypothetical protein